MDARRLRVWLVVITAVALVARVGFLVGDAHPSEGSNLSAVHGEMARQILDHGRWFETDRSAIDYVSRLQNRREELIDPADIDYARFDARPDVEPEALEPPGQALVLAGVWRITGDQSYIWLQILQVLLDAAMVPLVFWIAMRLYRRPRAGLIAAAGYAILPPLAALPRVPHLDTWAVTSTIVVTALFLRALDEDGEDGAARRRTGWLAATGVVAGLTSFFRPSMALLPIGLALAAAFSPRWTGWRPVLRLAGIPLAIVVLLLVPWTVRNYSEFDRFIPLRIGVGQNLWEGLGEIDNSIGAQEDDVAATRYVHSQDPTLRYGTPEFDDVLRERAMEGIREHPEEYLESAARRAVRSTVALHNRDWIEATDPGLTESPRDSLSHALSHPWDGVRLGLYALMEPLIFLLALVTMAATWRSLWRRHLFGIVVVVVSLGTYIVLHFEPRYVLTATFVYLILCGLGIDLALEARAKRRRERVSGDPEAILAP